MVALSFIESLEVFGDFGSVIYWVLLEQWTDAQRGCRISITGDFKTWPIKALETDLFLKLALILCKELYYVTFRVLFQPKLFCDST